MAVLGRVALLLLRHLREARNDVTAFRALVGRIADLLRLLPRAVDRRVVFAYMLNVVDVERARVESVLTEALPELREDVVTVADQIRREGVSSRDCARECALPSCAYSWIAFLARSQRRSSHG